MLHILLIVLLVTFSGSTIEKSNTTKYHNHRRRTFASFVYSTSTNNDNNHISLSTSDKITCQWLNRSKHQSKICNSKAGLSDVLWTARTLAIRNCQETFKYDQWNCYPRNSFFKTIYRESAVMYSIASSAITFAVARGCSEGTLRWCKCGDHGKLNGSYYWSGCADNTKFAKMFTRKFLQLRKKGDFFSDVIKHNSEVGIKMVMDNEEVVCKCHGPSTSCEVRTCKTQRDFGRISQQLKALYHSAVQVKPEDTVLPLLKNERSTKKKLLYVAASPNFCYQTINRICKSVENCATLCCGRGFQTYQVIENVQCDKRWRDLKKFQVEYHWCERNKTISRCF